MQVRTILRSTDERQYSRKSEVRVSYATICKSFVFVTAVFLVPSCFFLKTQCSTYESVLPFDYP